jgi:hypothetical protein
MTVRRPKAFVTGSPPNLTRFADARGRQLSQRSPRAEASPDSRALFQAFSSERESTRASLKFCRSRKPNRIGQNTAGSPATFSNGRA